MSQAPPIAADYRLAPDTTALNNIPGEKGIPYFGKALQFIFQLDTMAQDHYDKYGEISWVRALNKTWLLVLGADNWQKLLLDNGQNFSAEKGYETSLGDFYSGGLLLRDFDEHKLQRRIMQVAFKTPSMKTYVAKIDPVLKERIGQYDQVDKFLFGEHIKQTLLTVGARIFIGIDDSSAACDELNQAFVDINKGLVSLLKKEIPGTVFWRGKRGVRTLHRFFQSEIPARRSSDKADMFSIMCRATMEDGSYYADEDIVAHAAFLLFAAHDTTTSVLNSIVMYTAMDSEWQDKMRAEVMAIDKPALEYEDLEKLEVIDRVFHEALRLVPAAPIGTRRTVRECELGGYTIPAHTKIMIPFTFNHRDPRYWTNPDAFDPDRFSPERQEHKNHPFCYHPFGGGAHKCIGLHFANMLVKTFLFNFLKTYRYATPEGYHPRMQWAPLPRPTKLPLTLTRL